MDTPVPHIQEKISDVGKMIPQERVSERVAKQICEPPSSAVEVESQTPCAGRTAAEIGSVNREAETDEGVHRLWCGNHSLSTWACN